MAAPASLRNCFSSSKCARVVSRRAPAKLRTASRPFAAASGSTETTSTPVDTAPSLAHLKDPVKIGATGTSTSYVKDFGGDVSLHRYMTLPIEQYFVLDPSQIRFLGGDRFLLLVPRINIFNVWLEPEVEVTVRQDQGAAPKVLLVAQNCRIKGSDLIQQWRLDERFAIRFVTELTWHPSSPSPPPSPPPSAPPSPARAAAAAPHGGGGNGAPPPQQLQRAQEVEGRITAAAVLEVWSDVIPPFNLMPRELLVASCNAVMAGLVNSLLPLFSRRLASDYQKWGADATYRADRATRSSPLA